jgi:hypothetical protein
MNLYIKIKLSLAFIIILAHSLSAQIVYEPLHRDIYDFLSRLSQKGIIEFNDLIKPLPRKYIAEKLFAVKAYSYNELTSVEKEEIDFFLKDYYHENAPRFSSAIIWDSLTFFNYDQAERWRVFSYTSNLFKLNVSPILGLQIGTRDEEKLTHIWNGIYLYGYFNDYLGFSFDFRDNTEKGNTIDKTKEFTPITGVNARSNSNIIDYPSDKIEYSEVKTIITADWDWGSFSVGKDFFEWGYGEGGKLVLSQKAPSFPFVRLDLYPVEWLRFNYIHAWLSSDIIDSTDFYLTKVGTNRFFYREKFLASHSITVTPFKGFDISIGESIVYSDKLEFVYLMPLMFFRLGDHYLSRQYNAAGSNAQFFAGLSSKNHIKNTHLYGTLFIDEITLSGLFDKHKQRNQLGFSLGGSVTDLPIENLSLTAEYTKIYPFVYNHFIPTTTYESASYTLGHWMGNNADQIYGSLNYRFIRGLQATFWGQYIRKGETGSAEQQINIQPQPPFLFGLRTNYTYFGFFVKYELIHEMFIKGIFQYTKTSQQQADLRFIDTNLNEFYLAVYYGL